MSVPKYRWCVVFDAEDDKDADEQVNEAMDAFSSGIHSDELEQIEGDA